MRNNIENKAFVTSFTDESEGLLKAFVSVYGNIDSANEVVDFGAFKESLAYKLPVLCLFHNWELPVGKILVAEEIPAGDERLPENIKNLGGLYIQAQINLDKQLGKDAWSDIKLGVLTEYSIGYVVQESFVDKDGVKHLTKVDLIEASPVVRAANRLTSTVEIKSESFTKTQINTKQMNENIDELQVHLVAAMEPLDALKTEMAAQEILTGELEEKFNALAEPLQNALGFLDDLKIMLVEQGLLETVIETESEDQEEEDKTDSKAMDTEGTLSSLTEILTGLTALENEEVSPIIEMVQTLITMIEGDEPMPAIEEAQKAVETTLIEQVELEHLFSKYLNSQFNIK